ncbi:MAG: thermostable hemolysin [Gammaproteobacteria bacterium]|nr:thermostable hemolysin [Gammaproteobacteria bacterium]
MKSAKQNLNSRSEPTRGFGPSLVADDAGVVLVDADHPLRESAQAYIKKVYRKMFSAQVNHFSAELLVKLDARQRISGAVGVTLADEHPLFIEQYLREPVSRLLAAADQGFTQPTDNRQGQRIVEIGNLAMVDRCSVRQMICFLSSYLLEQQVDWVVFTARAELLNSFKRLKLPLTHLADAAVEQLDDKDNQWGSYYAGSPRVVAGRLKDVLLLSSVNTRRGGDGAEPSQESPLLSMMAIPGLFPVPGYR